MCRSLGCRWRSHEPGPPSIGYVAILDRRVDLLEAALRSHGVDLCVEPQPPMKPKIKIADLVSGIALKPSFSWHGARSQRSIEPRKGGESKTLSSLRRTPAWSKKMSESDISPGVSARSIPSSCLALLRNACFSTASKKGHQHRLKCF